MKKQYYYLLGILVVLLLVFIMMMPQKNTHVLIKTNLGDIKIKLYDSKSEVTVKNFLSYVDSGFYNNLVFHRVIDGFMIQGGGFDALGNQKRTNSPIELESKNGLKNSRGTIAMARTQIPDSATSQFFINSQDNYFLDYSSSNSGYAVFGEVISGMEIVDKISKVETSNKFGMNDWPIDEVIIISIERI